MDKHLNAPEAKFLLFKDGKPLMSMQTSGETKDKTPTGLLYLSQSSITTYLPSKSFAECPEPENKDVAKQYQSARLPSSLPALVFLGIDDRTEAKEGAVPAEVDPKDPKGVPYFAFDVSGANITLSALGAVEAEFVEPRLAGSSLGGWEANLFAQARALMGESEESVCYPRALEFRSEIRRLRSWARSCIRLRDETLLRLHLGYQPH